MRATFGENNEISFEVDNGIVQLAAYDLGDLMPQAGIQ